MAEIKVHPGVEYSYAQSRYPNAPQLPARCLIYAPSGQGKTTTLVSICTDILRQRNGQSCFARIFIWSPTIYLDTQWAHVRNFQEKVMKVPEEENDELYHDTFAEADLKKIVDRQHRIADLAKKRGLRTLPSVAIVLDDVADDVRIARGSQTLISLFLRGRHAGISTFLSTQVYKVAPAIRRNISCALYWRPRNLADKNAIVEETSNLAGGKENMEAIFEEATRSRHSFLYINFLAQSPEDYFWEGFTHRLTLAHSESDAEPPHGPRSSRR